MKFVLVLLALAAVIASSQALKCYVCSDSGCEDPYSGNSAHETECLFGVSWCNKAKNLYKLFGSEFRVVYRGCATTNFWDNSNCQKSTEVGDSLFGGEWWYCSCQGDRCNGSTTVAASFGLLAACLSKFLF